MKSWKIRQWPAVLGKKLQDVYKRQAFFSLEMSRDQLAQRMLCAAAEIDAQNLRNGRLTQEAVSYTHLDVYKRQVLSR